MNIIKQIQSGIYNDRINESNEVLIFASIHNEDPYIADRFLAELTNEELFGLQSTVLALKQMVQAEIKNR